MVVGGLQTRSERGTEIIRMCACVECRGIFDWTPNMCLGIKNGFCLYPLQSVFGISKIASIQIGLRVRKANILAQNVVLL